MKRTVALLLSLAAIASLSANAHADEAPTRPEKSESDEKPPPRVRIYTLLGGLGLTAAWWGAGVGTSYIWPDQSAMTDMRVPVAGPWLALAHESCNGTCDYSIYVSSIYYVLSGIAQAGGIAVALESLIVPTSNGERRPPTTPGPRAPDTDPDAPKPAPDAPTDKPLFFIPQPIRIGQSGWGMAVGGMF